MTVGRGTIQHRPSMMFYTHCMLLDFTYKKNLLRILYLYLWVLFIGLWISWNAFNFETGWCQFYRINFEEIVLLGKVFVKLKLIFPKYLLWLISELIWNSNFLLGKIINYLFHSLNRNRLCTSCVYLFLRQGFIMYSPGWPQSIILPLHPAFQDDRFTSISTIFWGFVAILCYFLPITYFVCNWSQISFFFWD